MKKRTLIIAVILACSMAVSPLRLYAEELDTPETKEDIEEIQHDDGQVYKVFYKQYMDGGVQKTLTVHYQFNYAITWEEGWYGYFNSANITIGYLEIDDGPTLYSSILSYSNSNGTVNAEYQINGTNVKFKVTIHVDYYGDIYHSVTVTAPVQS